MEPNKNNDYGKTVRNIILVLGVALVIILAFFLLFTKRPAKDKLQYSDIVAYFENNQVEEYHLDLGTGVLSVTLREKFRTDVNKDNEINKKDIITYNVPNVGTFYQNVHTEIVDKVNRDDDSSNDVKYDHKPVKVASPLVQFIPLFFTIGFCVFIYIMMRRSMSSIDGSGKGMSFGKARIKQPSDDKRKTTFADVAGADEEKEELRELVDFLKQPKKYKELGARIPKGILLVGPPGTGKTLLARAVAGEASVPFFSISGSDFVEMYVGVGASRVRDLFGQAKKNAPCIIFIDEIDAVGRQRGAGLGGGHDEREQTLNQLLVEMDGFGDNDGVIMIAATNRPDVLDPALMRPGRFDRQVVVNYPDVKGREEILKVHSRGKPLAPDVDLSVIARGTVGFTGADIENLLNEAALLAARNSLRSITMELIEDAKMKVILGTEKRSRVVTEKDKFLTSYHEAGHAVVSYFCPTQDPVHEISIIPRGRAGGYTLSLPQNDKMYLPRKEMLEDIQVCYGGRIAEDLIIGDISTGASSDIEQATKLARDMVIRYGMSDTVGPILYASNDNEVFLGRDFAQSSTHSNEFASEIDKEIKRIITTSYSDAERKLTENMDKLHSVAKYLIDYEKMTGDEFVKVMLGEADSKSGMDTPSSNPSGIDPIPPIASGNDGDFDFESSISDDDKE